MFWPWPLFRSQTLKRSMIFFASFIFVVVFPLLAVAGALVPHVLPFGKNAASAGYFVGVDALEVEELTPYVVKTEQKP